MPLFVLLLACASLPKSDVVLLGTVVADDPSYSNALLKAGDDTTTGVVIGGQIAGYTVLEIGPGWVLVEAPSGREQLLEVGR